MTDADEFYERALGRIHRNLIAVSVAGTAAACLWQGWLTGIGFLLGAAASVVNFYWLHRMVQSIGDAAEARRARGRYAWVMGFRYLLFGVAGYVIVRYFRISPAALVVGLLVVVAAVLLEILYELIYARA